MSIMEGYNEFFTDFFLQVYLYLIFFYKASLPLHPLFVLLLPLFEGLLVLRRALYLLGFLVFFTL